MQPLLSCCLSFKFTLLTSPLLCCSWDCINFIFALLAGNRLCLLEPLEGDWKARRRNTLCWCVFFSFHCYFSNWPSPLEWHRAPVSSLYFHIQRISPTVVLTDTSTQGPALPPQRSGSQHARTPSNL